MAAQPRDKELSKPSDGLLTIQQILFGTMQRCQNQTDTIVNQDIAIIEDLQSSGAKTVEYQALLADAVDTPEEQAWLVALSQAARNSIKYSINRPCRDTRSL